MEFIYFISGIIVAGFTYGAFLLRRAHTGLNRAMDSMQSFQNISSLRSSDLEEELRDIRNLIFDLKEDMESNSYDTVTNINKRLELLEKIEDRTGQKLSDFISLTEESFKQASGDIQTLKNNLKALGQDPNFLNRY